MTADDHDEGTEQSPTAEAIRRRGRGTGPAGDRDERPLPWREAEDRMRKSGWFWLATVHPTGHPQIRPVFAAWSPPHLFVASNPATRKSRNLLEFERCTLATDAGDAHLMIEGHAERVDDERSLRRAQVAFKDIYQWPTDVAGDQLDAPYGAPTSGGPPFDVFKITPQVGFGFPTDGESFAPTRWRFAPEAPSTKGPS